MKRDYITIVGICLIILVFAESASSGEGEQVPDPIGYSWINPDGSRGTALLPQLSLATSRSWVNPDGVGGILNEVKDGRVGLFQSGDWVNPDGVHGTFNQPTLGLTYSRNTSK